MKFREFGANNVSINHCVGQELGQFAIDGKQEWLNYVNSPLIYKAVNKSELK